MSDLDNEELRETRDSNLEKRKIIEIYVTENKEEDSASFEFIKCEDTEIADNTMKGLLIIFNTYKDDEDELKVEYEEE